MYLPGHFVLDDLAVVAEFVDQAGSADLVTFDGARPVSTLLPVIWERPPAGSPGHGSLLGHLALANPQWQTVAAGIPGLAIVHGPQAYVSPSWYQSTREHGRAVPTWNYRTVHFTGEVVIHRDEDWIRDVVTRLTERHERGRPGRWWVADAPEQFLAGQLRAIVGVELRIASIEAKDKLSQNRSAEDHANVIAALRSEPDPGSRAVADLMAARPPRERRPG